MVVFGELPDESRSRASGLRNVALVLREFEFAICTAVLPAGKLFIVLVRHIFSNSELGIISKLDISRPKNVTVRTFIEMNVRFL